MKKAFLLIVFPFLLFKNLTAQSCDPVFTCIDGPSCGSPSQVLPPNDCANSGNLCPPNINAPSCPADSCALVTLWCRLGQPGSLLSWNSSLPYSEWEGVTVNSSGCVTELCLSFKGLTGELPAIIANFSTLEKLDLSGNGGLIGNQTASSFAHLAQNPGLTYLNLSNTGFKDDIAKLNNTSLQFLDLSNTAVFGEIPASIKNFSDLCYLDLSLTSIDGTIPNEIGNLSSLKYLNLSLTGLQGEIPQTLGNLSSLQVLDLHNCSLDTIPASLGNLSLLECMNLEGCNLTGQIPGSFKLLSKMTTLNLGNNDLNGCMSELAPLCLSLTDYEFDQINSSNLISDLAFMQLCFGTYTCCPALAPTADTTLCEGQPLTLFSGNNNAGLTFIWTLPNGTNSNGPSLDLGPVTGNEFGTYLISVDDGSCESIDSVIVDSIPATTSSFTFSVNNNNNLTLNFTSTATNFDSLRWSFGDGGTSVDTFPTHTYTSDGLYEICLTAYGICTDVTTCDTVSLGTPQPVMVAIPDATDFVLGCVLPPCAPDEEPNGTTVIDSFRISATEITQAQYQSVMGNNPSQFTNCSNCPVETVSWFDAVLFCNRLSLALQLEPCYFANASLTEPYTGGTEVWWDTEANGFRLPTEAEWEHAAKGGSPPDNTPYAGSAVLDDVAWHQGNSSDRTHDVALKNAVGIAPGIFDMTGNVAEWCWGVYGADDYQNFPACNPLGHIGPGTERVIRGGSWNSREPQDEALKVFNRNALEQTLKSGETGFRIAQNAGN